MIRSATLLALLAFSCGEPDPQWHRVFDPDLDRAVLAAATYGDRVVIVGGGLEVAGSGALLAEYSGGSWSEISTGFADTLWWTWLDTSTGDIWAVGENGLAIRVADGSVDVIATSTTATLFGVWGTGTNDVWIVGGDAGAGTDKDIVLHWDGNAITAVTAAPVRNAALFKVWGLASGELWISGEGGTMLHLDPSATWIDESAQLNTTSNLLTVHGCSADEVYAVGGQLLYGRMAGAWAPVDNVELLGTANGVSCAPAGVLVVGNGGLKLFYDRQLDEWRDDRFESPFDTDFHGAAITDDGELWAVGGNFLLPADFGPRIGIVGVFGKSPPPDSL